LFLKKVRRMMDEEYPGRVLIAEANQWPWDLLPYFGDGDEFHICFHFPIMPRLFMALRQGVKEPILKILAQTPDIPPGAQWMTFLRNHDELTLEMVTPDEREWMWQQYAPNPAMRSNLGIRRRLAPLLDNHRGKWLILNAILVSLMGTPIIYYGDEIGMGDNIALPDRHGLRTPMQWDSSPNAGFSSAANPYNPVISDPVYGYQQINVAAQDRDPGSYLNALRFLLAVRRDRPELRRGKLTMLDNDDQAVFGYWRSADSSRTLCLYNLGAEANSISLDLAGHRGGRLLDLLHEGRNYPIDDYPVVIRLRPYASHWLTVEDA
jgi:maltose alpha-D-glucosyltransferase/alpha-amylase